MEALYDPARRQARIDGIETDRPRSLSRRTTSVLSSSTESLRDNRLNESGSVALIEEGVLGPPQRNRLIITVSGWITWPSV
jgi:hypothetical protein